MDSEFVIVYEDGAYELNHGSGFPCFLLEEARKFASLKEAEEHSANLVNVKEIKQIK